MDVRCERCQTEYEVEDATVSALGTEVQCSDCGHQFVVKRPDNVARPAGKSPSPDDDDGGAWVIETTAGRSLRLRDLTTLHKWIIERRVVRADRLSRGGEPAQRLGDMADLSPFFDIVDSAERAKVTETPPPAAKGASSISHARESYAAVSDTPPPAAQPAPLAPPVLEPPTASLETPPPEHHPQKSAHAPARSPTLPATRANVAKPSLGAFPTTADHDETAIIQLKPAKSHSILKLLVAVAVAAAVAYAGILWHHHFLRQAVISSSGTTEDLAPQRPKAEKPRIPPVPSPEENSAAAGEPSEVADPAAARGPVVEPIADEAPDAKAHLPSNDSGRAAPTGPRAVRTPKASPPAARGARAGASKPGSPQAQAAQGYVALTHQQYPHAIALFRRALAGNPTNGTAIFGLAEAYRGSGHVEPALENYRRYIELQPSGPDAGVARFQIRILQKKIH